MALSAASVWEVRTAGLDTNGGGFVAGAAGTDYSQQDAKNTAGSNISTTDAVAVGTGVITSATAAFTSAIVGNIIYLQGGTGALAAGWYQVTVFTSSTSITVDRNVAAGTGITMNIGGALLTIGQALTNMTVANNTAWVKVGTYNITSALATGVGGSGTFNNRLIGYNATRGDEPLGANRPTVATNGNAINGFNMAHDGWEVRNFIFDGAGASRGLIGLNITAQYPIVHNVKVKDFDTRGVYAATNMVLFSEGEITACSEGMRIATQNTRIAVVNSCIHANTGPGVVCDADSNGITFTRTAILNNSGASSDGLSLGTAYAVRVLGCTLYGNGRDGIRATAAYAQIGSQVSNNLIVGNGGYGINYSSVRASNFGGFNYNAFYNNTSGARNVILAGPNDVTLTADPFTNAAGGDFSLNTTAGGGAAARAVGFPGAVPGISTTGHLDIGAVQHADPASSGGQSVSIFGG